MMKKAGPDPLAETASSGRQRMVVVIQMPAAARTATTMPAMLQLPRRGSAGMQGG